jgi:hypothetical protein
LQRLLQEVSSIHEAIRSEYSAVFRDASVRDDRPAVDSDAVGALKTLVLHLSKHCTAARSGMLHCCSSRQQSLAMPAAGSMGGLRRCAAEATEATAQLSAQQLECAQLNGVLLAAETETQRLRDEVLKWRVMAEEATAVAEDTERHHRRKHTSELAKHVSLW